MINADEADGICLLSVVFLCLFVRGDELLVDSAFQRPQNQKMLTLEKIVQRTLQGMKNENFSSITGLNIYSNHVL